MWNAWRLKIAHGQKCGFRRCFEGKIFIKMISLFVIFVCEDSKKLLCCLYGTIFQFYVQKCPENEEDADVSDLCGPARRTTASCQMPCLHAVVL